MPAGTHVAAAAAAPSDLETLDEREVEQAYVAAEEERLQAAHSHSLLGDMLSIESVLTDAASAVIDDSFNKCFTSTPSDPWNWNLYLFPMWWAAVCVHTCVCARVCVCGWVGGWVGVCGWVLVFCGEPRSGAV